MAEVFFVDNEMKKFSNEKISSHIGLAQQIVEQNKDLKDEYEKSGKNLLEFLIVDKGYITLSELGSYKAVVFASSSISEKQKRYILGCYEEGYRLENLSTQLKKKQKENEER